MRSKSPHNKLTSNTNSSIERITSRARLPVALTALVTVLSLGTSADAGWLGGRGFGGGGPIGFTGGRVTSRPLGIVNPVGSIGKVGNPSVAGGPRIGGGRTGGGGGGDDHPRKPRVPKLPIIVAVPSAVAPVTAGATSSQLKSNGNGPSSSGGQGRRTGNGAPPADERRYVPDEVLIQMASTVSDETIDALARRMQLNRVESFTTGGVVMVRSRILDGRSVPTVIRQLQGERIVLAVQANFLYQVREQLPASDRPQASDTEGDPGQYALAKLRLPQAHTLAKGEKVLVAVIDSGVDATHPELEGMIEESFDAIGSGEKAHSHGTAVAGAIVAHARLLGVAPQARILAVQAFSLKNQTAEATTYIVSKGIDWAMSRGARVINMSFTGERDPSIEQRMAHAHRQGLVLIAAAGNAGPKSKPLYPAAYPNVIAVTATDADDKLFTGANQGHHIAVAAPGVDLLLPRPERGYQVTTGTSFAAAEVSGIVALMLERRPDLGHDRVRKALTATARDLGPKGFDPQFGAGLVDAYAAIRSLEPAPATTAAKEVPSTTGLRGGPATIRQ